MRSGLTLIEILVVVAIIGILAGISPLLIRPPAARVFANDVAFTIRRAHFEAIKRDVAVAVVWDAANQRLETRITKEGTYSCSDVSSSPPPRSHDARAYGTVTVTTNLGGNGLLWFPNGTTRACDGNLAAGTIVVRDARATVTVAISGTGSVEVQ
jgi:prepilin-type N-terminal cleavage/methylation domain-containing protein